MELTAHVIDSWWDYTNPVALCLTVGAWVLALSPIPRLLGERLGRYVGGRIDRWMARHHMDQRDSPPREDPPFH